MHIMRSLWRPYAWIIISLAVLILAGCPGPQPASSQRNQTDENDTSQETRSDPDAKSTSDLATESVEESIANAAFDLLARLGCDTSALEVISMELLQSEYSLLWGVIIGNDLNEIANFHINEETLQVEFMIVRHSGDVIPPTMNREKNLITQFAEALGLEVEGYRLAGWLQPDKVGSEYRKYARQNDWEIAVGRVHIGAPPDAEAKLVFSRIENELVLPVNIQISRDDAVSAAQSFLDDSDAELSHVELIQLRCEPYGPTDFRVYWEVVFGEQVVHVDADDGTIMEAP